MTYVIKREFKEWKKGNILNTFKIPAFLGFVSLEYSLIQSAHHKVFPSPRK